MSICLFQKNKTEIIATFGPIREKIALGNRISIADVLAARTGNGNIRLLSTMAKRIFLR